MPYKNLVIGAGLTGQSVMSFLERHQQPFTVFDTRTELPNLATLQSTFPSVEFICGDESKTNWTEINRVVVSPGLSPRTPVLLKAQSLKIPVVGDLALFAEACTKPVIAITGTNGKSTVTSLVGEMLAATGLKVAVAGNIGVPMLSPTSSDLDVWVLELSSFQLWYQDNFKPTVSCVLNMSEDHLDWHHDFDEYKQAKHKIYRLAEKKVFNLADPNSYPENKEHASNFSLHQQSGSDFYMAGNTFYKKQQALFTSESLSLTGSHNYVNILAALAIVDAYGIDVQQCYNVLMTFSGLAHRSETVRVHNGVKWINDSKGTNVGAAMAALTGVASTTYGKVVWLAGGEGKGADFKPLNSVLKDSARCAILFGVDKKAIENILPENVPAIVVDSMKDAVTAAQQAAQTGDSVLLSPACASFDMFDNYMQRGDVFSELVRAL